MSSKPRSNSSLPHHTVHIIGLGWLGLPLAKQLHSAGMKVSGTVRSDEKRQHLLCEGLDVDKFDLYSPFTSQYSDYKAKTKERFLDANLVVNIPPGRSKFHPHKFIASMRNLIDTAMTAGLRKLIFISTTSVYGSQTGTISNASALSPSTDSGKAHQDIEHHLQLNYPERYKILRPAGLVGPKLDGSPRHPIYTLYKKTNIPNGNDPVNLVHQADVIQAIESLIVKETDGTAFNIAALEHPSRKEYYAWCAQTLKLKQLTFMQDTKKRQLGKLVDASETYKALGIQAIYPSPFTML
jgi:nucleoside-diphosphate-sugar epimerase